jgi:hypothetical protein
METMVMETAMGMVMGMAMGMAMARVTCLLASVRTIRDALMVETGATKRHLPSLREFQHRTSLISIN